MNLKVKTVQVSRRPKGDHLSRCQGQSQFTGISCLKNNWYYWTEKDLGLESNKKLIKKYILLLQFLLYKIFLGVNNNFIFLPKFRNRT